MRLPFNRFVCSFRELALGVRAVATVATSALSWRYFLLRPIIAKVCLKGFVLASWTAPVRMRKLIEHLHLARELDLPYLPYHPLMVVFSEKLGDQRYRLTIDQPEWLWQEGLLCFSMWEGTDRVFSLCFLLSREHDQLLAYVGGIQGRREVNMLERYRAITKVTHGTRPRDFLVESFRMFCNALGVGEIRAVTLSNYYTQVLVDHPNLPYDEIWKERGGVDTGVGYFALSIGSLRRPVEQIPPRKRAQYQRRYALFDQIDFHFRGLKGVPAPRQRKKQRTPLEFV